MPQVALSQHLAVLREQMNTLHAQILQTYQLAIDQPAGARVSFNNQLSQIRAMEQGHGVWSQGYFAEVRELFGLGSVQEQRGLEMIGGVSRWIAMDFIWVLLGSSMAAVAGGDVAYASGMADDALRRCEAAAQQGVDFELSNLRIAAWGQMALVAYKAALDDEYNPQAWANGANWAQRCYEESARAGFWVQAAIARAIQAGCAWYQGDRATFGMAAGEAVQLATNTGAMMRNLGLAGTLVPMAGYIQSWMWEIQTGSDRTGDSSRRVAQLSDVELVALVHAAHQLA